MGEPFDADLSGVRGGDRDEWGFGRTRHLEGNAAQIAEEVVREILDWLFVLNEVGLGYLSLERRADTLSAGHAQRIRLAAQVGSGSGWSVLVWRR